MVEIRDESPRVFLRLALLLFALALFALGLATAQFGWLNRGFAPAPAAPRPVTPAGPLLEVDPVEALRRQRLRDAEILGTYGWTDRERGLVRVPVERAMELLLEQGLPVRE